MENNVLNGTQSGEVVTPRSITSKKAWKHFFEVLDQDAETFCQKGKRPSSFFYFKTLLGFNKFSAVLLYRVTSILEEKGFQWLADQVYKRNYKWNSCEIYPRAEIGPGLYLPHPLGVVIGTIRAGRNLIVQQNATIGLKDRKSDWQDHSNFASFGDNVFVGANAVILGDVAIGHNAVIGAGAVVLKDVPAGYLAVGNPARVLPRRIKADDKACTILHAMIGTMPRTVRIDDDSVIVTPVSTEQPVAVDKGSHGGLHNCIVHGAMPTKLEESMYVQQKDEDRA